jgi:putative DNA primase/helicase
MPPDHSYDGPPPDDDADIQGLLFDVEDPSVEELAEASPRCTDSANVDAIVREHGRGYLYVTEWEQWIAWDGRRWDISLGARGRVEHAAALTARLEYYRTKAHIDGLQAQLKPLLLDALRDADKVKELDEEIKRQTQILRWHAQSQNASRIEAAVRLLRTRLVVRLADLDRDPWLFNVANGTIDLRTAELRPHDRDDLCTQLSDIEWSDGATCPTWDSFMRDVMGGHLDLVLYLQRLVGYALTALTREHLLAFFYGTGLNGKSTFLQTMRLVFGEYGCAAARDLLFEDKHGKRHPEEIAKLYGKRLVICAEIGENHAFDEAKVKDLTGGDVVSARRMRENSWDLTPTHTLFLAGNHKPTVRGDDLGIWRRIRLVPWTVTISAESVDKELPEKLRAELPGILRWAVQGCLEWQRVGLVEPQAVLDATSDYRAESDVLGEFLSNHVVFEPEARVTRQGLRQRYEEWCEESGHVALGARKVAQRLRERGVASAPVREAGRVKDGWSGCRLLREGESILTPALRLVVGPVGGA